MVAVPGIWAAGNHGFEFARPGAEPQAHPDAAPYRAAVAAGAADLTAALAGVTGVLVEDKLLTISVHYRLVSPDAVPTVLAATERVARARNLRARGGKMVVELRPPLQVDKGSAVLALADELGASGAGASLLFAGDDVTDEDAFERLRAEHPHAVTVHVGDRLVTAAEFQLDDTAAFQALLAAVLADRAGR
jgi:trehalose 6-phosphate phosphatase